MACKKLGSKADAFHRQGQAWFCSTGLPSDVSVEVGETSFHLHKFPLLSKSGLLEKLIREKSDDGEDTCVINLSDIPGGSKAFELVAKFCYGIKFEMTASNVVCLRCASEHLEMTEEIAEDNLITQAETFLNQVVFRSWIDSVKALRTCDSFLPHAEDMGIIKRCIDSLASKAFTDPNLFRRPILDHGPMQSPGGSVLWNGISTGARPRNSSSDWWYEDISSLSLPFYKRLLSAMESRGARQEIISGSLTSYARRHLPGLNRRQSLTKTGIHLEPIALAAALPEEEQKHLLEEIDRLLPLQKGVASVNFLFGLLRTAMILQVSESCISNLERRIGMQLHQANLDDLLIPNFSGSTETLYEVECIHRVLEHFLAIDQTNTGSSTGDDNAEHFLASPSLTPISLVAKLIDGYLAEVASDVNLKLPTFRSLAAAIPDYARFLDDGLYRAIDIYLKAHSWLTELDREELCRLMDCQKLSLEACTHAAQNERLPLRVVVQVLFFEQLQLRSSITGCILASDNLDASRPLSELAITNDGGWPITIKENKTLKEGMENMMMKVSELEKECSSLKEQIEKLANEKSRRDGVRRKFGSNIKSQMCSAEEGSVKNGRNANERELQLKLTKLEKELFTDM